MPRIAKKQTKNELETFIKNFLEKCEYEPSEDYTLRLQDVFYSMEEYKGTSKLMKDLDKKEIHFENILLKENVEEKSERTYFYDNFSLMGYQQFQDLSFYGILGCSDYGIPIYFVLYEDDKGSLRGYIPTKGNSFNPFSKMPFGEDQVSDDKFANSKGFATVWEMEEQNYQFLSEEDLVADILKRITPK